MMKPVRFGNNDYDQDDNPHTFFTEKSSKIYEHYLDYALEDPSKARQLCTLLRGVEEHDIVFIRVNSPGGRFDLCAQILNAIRECRAKVVGVIEQECASAATMIFLACDQWQVQPWAEMMIHNASYGVIGKSHEVSARVRASEERMRQVITTEYKGFLEEDEINRVLDGADIYLTADQIVARLEKLAEIRNKESEDEESEEVSEYLQVSEDSEE